jgi:hypothetical protein
MMTTDFLEPSLHATALSYRRAAMETKIADAR